jgi:predicted enzyme related to lactoylglutathione lyase
MSNQRPHRINWFEIPVTNLDEAAALYSATLGVELKREVLFGVPQAIFLAEGEGVTGSLISDPKRAPQRGVGTVVYLDVKDGVAASLARAIAAGAKVVQPTTDIAPFGEIALIEDPDGNVIGLHARS